MTSPTIDPIEACARALHSAYVGNHPTREVHLWFGRLFARIAEARGASSPVVNPSAPPVAVQPAPEPAPAAPVLDHVTCPRCLSKRADRGHVEQHRVCLDCLLAGHAPAAEPPPRNADRGAP